MVSPVRLELLEIRSGKLSLFRILSIKRFRSWYCRYWLSASSFPGISSDGLCVGIPGIRTHRGLPSHSILLVRAGEGCGRQSNGDVLLGSDASIQLNCLLPPSPLQPPSPLFGGCYTHTSGALVCLLKDFATDYFMWIYS